MADSKSKIGADELDDGATPVARRRFLTRAAAFGVGAAAAPAVFGQATTGPAAGTDGRAEPESVAPLGGLRSVAPSIAPSVAPSVAPSAAGRSALSNLGTLTRGVRSRRISSHDISGGNVDRQTIAKGEAITIADIQGAGCIRHLWMTTRVDNNNLRGLVLRIYWDGEETPSVLCPVGDFFGLGHARPNYYTAAPMSAAHLALNAFWAMPFATGARITVTNDSPFDSILYYYIDYHEFDAPQPDTARFHVNFRRTLYNRQLPSATAPAAAATATAPTTSPALRYNLDGARNLVVLDVEGSGHYVGCFLHLDTDQPGWWGEGDDMIYIDGEAHPPRIYGTGTEDYFCGAWNYNGLDHVYSTPYYGYSFKGNGDYTGKHSQYRFHIEDPIFFEKRLRFTIEHGHDNDRSGDWTSTAYWYQVGRTQPLPDVGAFDERLPYAYGGVERPWGMKSRDDLPDGPPR